MLCQSDQHKARVRAKVERRFRVIKCQFGCAKVRRGARPKTQRNSVSGDCEACLVRGKERIEAKTKADAAA